MSLTEPPQLEQLFDTVLVANRGEIARRVIRTLRKLGIRSVAVFSDADSTAPHVREADVAVRIGPAAPAESYLNIAAVLGAARDTGAQAIHPGYGFLSENVAFARACADAGVVFIGPDERALDVMGDKIRSKEHVAAHGVPTVPGFSAAGMTDTDIADAAESTGYPLLVKPSAGGGGKGMQVVRSAADLADAVATARRVAVSAFGDDTLLLERLIERPRHIEVQVLADVHGAVTHLGERECTLQRRHQKVIEEAPSPVVDAQTRARLGAAACAAAASVDYRGAGTVEFLVSSDRPDDFFFIEMNTRLQVEHPVTELVTGIDLVEQQLRVAAGKPLQIAQEDIRFDGHAIEARVYAESPERGFLPSTGDIRIWQAAPGVRTDSAIETGSTVSADYDPMIGKVIAHGVDRADALAKLDAALADTVVLGVDTNIAFLRALVANAAVQAGDMDTGLIDRLPAFEPPALSETAFDAAATVSVTEQDAARERTRTAHASPLWLSRSGWRMGAPAVPPTVHFQTDAGDIVERSPRGAEGASADVHVATARDGRFWVHADGTAAALRLLSRREVAERRLAQRERDSGAADPELRAPMPGAVVALHTTDGSLVAAGDRLLAIEAMKMEHLLTAPHAGTVRVQVSIGDQVARDQVLARVDPLELD